MVLSVLINVETSDIVSSHGDTFVSVRQSREENYVNLCNVRCEVLSAVSMEKAVVCDVTHYSVTDIYRRFEEQNVCLQSRSYLKMEAETFPETFIKLHGFTAQKVSVFGMSENYTLWYIHDVPGGKFNILGGHSIGHSKQKKCICTRVLFRTVSEIELWMLSLARRNVKTHLDEQHAMSSHELQSALTLAVDFSKIYYSR
jgi:hypothetical protein